MTPLWRTCRALFGKNTTMHRLFVPLFVSVAIALVPISVTAQELLTEEAATALADSAMQKIVANDIDGAIALLRPHASLDWGELNVQMKRLSDTFAARPAFMGESLSYVFVKRETLADTVMHLMYIQKFRYRPLRWEFFFYKPERGWRFTAAFFQGAEPAMFNMVPIPQPPSQPTR